MLKRKNMTPLQYIVFTDTRYLRQFINFILYSSVLWKSTRYKI